MEEKKFHRRAGAAQYLQKNYGFGTYSSLATLACQGTGPEMMYAGRLPIYTEDALDRWALSKMSAPVCRSSDRHRDSSPPHEPALSAPLTPEAIG